MDVNRYDASLQTSGSGPTINNLDDQFTRPEAWRLLLGEHAQDLEDYGLSPGDGGLGLVGPDYGDMIYPDDNRKYAFRFREERTKRPVNIKNILTTTSSKVLGNFYRNYEIFNFTNR